MQRKQEQQMKKRGKYLVDRPQIIEELIW